MHDNFGAGKVNGDKVPDMAVTSSLTFSNLFWQKAVNTILTSCCVVSNFPPFLGRFAIFPQAERENDSLQSRSISIRH